MEIVWDQWRHTIYPQDGSASYEVTILRGTVGDYAYQTPIYDEYLNEVGEESAIEDSKKLLTKILERELNET